MDPKEVRDVTVIGGKSLQAEGTARARALGLRVCLGLFDGGSVRIGGGGQEVDTPPPGNGADHYGRSRPWRGLCILVWVRWGFEQGSGMLCLSCNRIISCLEKNRIGGRVQLQGRGRWERKSRKTC